MGKKLMRRMAAVALALALAGGVALPARARDAQEASFNILRRMIDMTSILTAQRAAALDMPLPTGIAARVTLSMSTPDALLCGFTFSPEELKPTEEEFESLMKHLSEIDEDMEAIKEISPEYYAMVSSRPPPEHYRTLMAELSPERFQAFSDALTQGLPEQMRALAMQAQALNVLDVQLDEGLSTIRLTVDAPSDQRWDVYALLPLLVQWAQRIRLLQALHPGSGNWRAPFAVEVYALHEGEPLLLERFEMWLNSFTPWGKGGDHHPGSPVQVTPLPAPAGFTSFTISPQAQALYFDNAEVLAQYGEDVGTDKDARFTLSAEQLAAFRGALTEQFRVQFLRRALAEETLAALDVQVLDDFAHIVFYANNLLPYWLGATVFDESNAAVLGENMEVVLDESSALGWAMQYALAMQKMLGAPGMTYAVEAYVLHAHDRIWPVLRDSTDQVVPSRINVRDFLFMRQ